MGNRAQRRMMMRQTTERNKKLISEYSEKEKVLGLIRNGITEKDLDDAYHDGFNMGFKASAISMMKTCMAGVAAALKDTTDLSNDDIGIVLKELNDKMLWACEHQELVDETLEKTGMEIVFDDGIFEIKRHRR